MELPGPVDSTTLSKNQYGYSKNLWKKEVVNTNHECEEKGYTGSYEEQLINLIIRLYNCTL